MGIPESRQKEQYSVAYLSIISATAGFNFVSPVGTDYGVDASIREVIHQPGCSRICETGITMDFQLKATQKWKYSNDNKKIIYSLEVKNYNDLIIRKKSSVPLILALLCLPKKGDFHPHNSCISLVLQHAMYWYVPSEDLKHSNNKKTVNIYIPASHILTAKALSDLMSLYKKKGGII